MAGQSKGKNLGDLLLQNGLLKPSELHDIEKEVKEAGRKFVEVVVSRGYITQETLVTALSFLYQSPIMDLRALVPHPEALALVPQETAKRWNILPVAMDRNRLLVVMEDPGDSQLIDHITALTRKRIQVVLSLHDNIKDAIIYHYQGQEKADEVALAKKKMAKTIAENLIADARRAGAEAIFLAPDAAGEIEAICQNGAGDSFCWFTLTAPSYPELVSAFKEIKDVELPEVTKVVLIRGRA